MPVEDIRQLKMRLRKQYRTIREEMDPSIRKEADESIANTVRKL